MDTKPEGVWATVEPLEVDGVEDHYFVFRVRRNLAADDVMLTPELSADLSDWRSGPGEIIFIGRERVDVTSEDLLFRSAQPTSSDRRRFGRVRLNLR